MTALLKHESVPVFVWSFDENFVEPAVASIHSALKRLDRDSLPVVAILGRNIGARSRQRFERWLRSRHARAKHLWVDGSGQKLPPSALHYTDATYLRLLIPDLLLCAQRAIYIDTDTVVVGNIGDLWREPLDGKPVGAVRDEEVLTVSSSRGLRMWEQLGLNENLTYVNAGVLVMDLCQWRRLRATDASMRFAQTYSGELRFADQDILNGVFAGQIKLLSSRYNLTSQNLPDGEAGPIVIRHFAGPIKPWNGGITVPGVWLYYSTLWDAGWRMAAVRGLLGRLGCTLRRLIVHHLGRIASRRGSASGTSHG